MLKHIREPFNAISHFFAAIAAFGGTIYFNPAKPDGSKDMDCILFVRIKSGIVILGQCNIPFFKWE